MHTINIMHAFKFFEIRLVRVQKNHGDQNEMFGSRKIVIWLISLAKICTGVIFRWCKFKPRRNGRIIVRSLFHKAERSGAKQST